MLSQAEIDRMVQEAEMYAAEDYQIKSNIEAKNGLENYCFTMRKPSQEGKLKDKFETDGKIKIETALQETLVWLDKISWPKKTSLKARS